jgi:IPTL-CTERM motif
MLIAPGRVLLLLVLVLIFAAGRGEAAPPPVTLAGGLTFPQAVAVDSSGDIFVADGNRIKEIVAVGGIIPANPAITVVQSFDPFPPGSLVLDATGNLFVTAGNQVYEFTVASAYQSPGAIGPSGFFANLFGLALDASGNIFVSDGSTIFELTAASGYATANMLVQVDQPASLAADAAGDIFFSSLSGPVFEALAVSGAIPANPTVNQLPGTAQLSALVGLALDAAGNVYVSSDGTNAVYEVPAAGGYAGAVALATSGLNSPGGIALDRIGNVYIADTGDQAVKEIQLNLPPPAPTLGQCGLILFGLLLAGVAAGRAMRVSAQHALALVGIAIGLVAGRAEAATFLTLARGVPAQGVAVDAKRNVFFAGGFGVIQELVAEEGILPPTPVIRTLFPPNNASFAEPTALALDGAGNLFVADGFQQEVFEVTAASGYTSVQLLGGGAGFNNLSGLATDSPGNLYIADGTNVVSELTVASGYTTVIRYAGPWSLPVGVAVDAAGDVFVADSVFGVSNGVVWEMLAVDGALPASPTITQLAAGFSFGTLQSITVDAAGNVFVGDLSTPAIDETPAAGGYASAQSVPSGVVSPFNLAVDNLSNVYIADPGNAAIEELQFHPPAPVPTLGRWGLILFGLVLAGASYRGGRRAA